MLRPIKALCVIALATQLFGCGTTASETRTSDCVTFDGEGGGNISFDSSRICKIDGSGNWTIAGKGQDLRIEDKKDGRGSATLRRFGSVTIAGKKDGDGSLIVDDCSSFAVNEINGNGHTYLRCTGAKTIARKDGNGNVYYRGQPPTVGQMNGAGRVIPE